MDYRELRIGNLLQDGISKAVLVVCKIEIGIITTIVKDRDKYPLANGWYNEPIQLTEEWLLKFGFIKNQTSWTNWKRPNITKEVRIGVQGKYLFYNGLSVISVHQLQNLYFALTGTELSPN